MCSSRSAKFLLFLTWKSNRRQFGFGKSKKRWNNFILLHLYQAYFKKFFAWGGQRRERRLFLSSTCSIGPSSPLFPFFPFVELVRESGGSGQRADINTLIWQARTGFYSFLFSAEERGKELLLLFLLLPFPALTFFGGRSTVPLCTVCVKNNALQLWMKKVEFFLGWIFLKICMQVPMTI